ncbi:protein mono-ADP-ribosyltransferase PARP14 isoform X1 [Ornithorhynchus anatinus]|nr:protein mono-ADP-ribosyltransferase PARP14 isoform X1 [Ornithorhynchus anatinus]
MEPPDPFPLLVEGPWGPRPPKKLLNKLRLYFQSGRRSGGGECVLRLQPGDPPTLLVLFAQDHVRSRVLQQAKHEAVLLDEETVRFSVRLPDHHRETPRETTPAQESTPDDAAPNPGAPGVGTEGTEEAAAGTAVVVVSAVGVEEPPQTLVELYFESKKHSGGGPIRSCRPGQQGLVVTFENPADAQHVSRRGRHVVDGVELCVRPWPEPELPESPEPGPPRNVALLDIPKEARPEYLAMLVERYSGLTEEDDFFLEMVPQLSLAVVTFRDGSGVEEFTRNFNERKKNQNQIVAKTLEPLDSVMVEGLPPGSFEDYLTIYFESPKNGGGSVSGVTLDPEENSAIVTFGDPEVLSAVLAKEHFVNKKAVSVHAYCRSLGTALYGKEGPPPRLPAPLPQPVCPHAWRLLHHDARLAAELEEEMRARLCLLEWAPPDGARPEITLHPAPALAGERAAAIRGWTEAAAAALDGHLARFRAARLAVTPAAWAAVGGRLSAEGVLTLHDPEGHVVTLVGRREDVDRVEPEWRALVDREQRSFAEAVAVPPAQLDLLRRCGLEEDIRAAGPDLRVGFDAGHVALTGLEAEVFRAKCHILERLQGLARGPCDLCPRLVSFLRRVDSAAFSRTLFAPSGIFAFYELDGEAVVITASSPQALAAAREEMRKGVGSRSIPVADPTVLDLSGWRELVDGLPGPDSQSPVLVDDLSKGPGAEVVVTGHSPALEAAYGPLAGFVDGNTLDWRLVPVALLVTLRYLEQREKLFWDKLEREGLTVAFVPDAGRRGVFLRGPRLAVASHLPRVQEVVAAPVFREVPLERPGEDRFFRDQESLLTALVKEQFGCLIHLREEGEDHPGGAGGPGPVLLLKDLPGGVRLVVRQGDLARYPADAVVNPSNEDLKHSGGLAGHLARHAGPELQEACRLLVRKSGPVPPGEAVATGAWSLPYGQVIHAVGPRWKPDDPKGCAALLGRAVRQSLRLADLGGHGSVAVPALSAGIFGFPLALCAETIVEAVAETSRGGLRAVREVHLVDLSEETVRALAVAAARGPGELDTAPVAAPKQRSHLQGQLEVLSTLRTQGGLKMVLESGRIEAAKTQVIVSGVAPDLRLGNGVLGSALLRAAGPELQVQLESYEAREKVVEGSVFPTVGGKLCCTTVLHVVIPQWDNGAGTAEQILKDVTKKCLDMTEGLCLQSVTFPAIGSGNLGYPPALVARTMVEEVDQFNWLKQSLGTLSEVRFVVFPENEESIQAFSSEFHSRKGNAVLKPQPVPRSLKAPSNPGHVGICKAVVGPVQLKVSYGDITWEKGDAIVNITNASLTLRKGVSKAIMEAAGQAIVDQCAQLGAQSPRRIVVTSGGALPCKNIIHLITQGNVKAMVTCVLQECEKCNFSSVTFPAIGTGAAQLNPEEAADSMIGAIFKFVETQRLQALRSVKIVIFQQHLQAIFCASLQKQVGLLKPSKPEDSKLKISFPSRLQSKQTQKAASKKKTFLQKESEGSVFQLCGPTEKKVDAAASWLRDRILKESSENTISDDLLEEFDPGEEAALKELQEFHRVQLKEDSPTSLRVSGLTRDVLVVCNKIQELLRQLRTAKEEEAKAELCSRLVRWQRSEGGQPVPFDKLTNLALETAHKEGKVISVLVNQQELQVDFSAMQVTGYQGNSWPIQRVSLQGGKLFELPKEWEDMKEQEVKVVPLRQGSREYQNVQARFCQTCSKFRIITIDRIQNLYLWQSYQVKKQSMDTKKDGASNERQLFHGTAPNTIDHINKMGFNRSYAGLHAALLGNGTYFAVNANYSANDTYSKPNIQGIKFMYLARVLTGEFCVGWQGLITPPAKNTQDPTDLYDTVTDQLTAPSMFIVFNDTQAYPEYLIKFTK